ncbi:MAG: class A beta-lactamase-related serine hydrolase [Acidobacteria bacterium]|nr:class A beta-lactamase-related serine hydrolase [Acidobacteriota bacterium]
MKLPRLLFLLFGLLLISHALYAQDDNLSILKRKLITEIEKVAGNLDGVMGVAIKDLTTGEEISINSQMTFPTGSSIKIPVLIELHKQAAEGKFKLTDQRRIERKDKVSGSGVIQHFSDLASQLSLNDLAVLMIVLSDNTATNMLIDQVGMANVNSTLDQLGLKQIRLRRKMIDQAASARGDENTATPREAMLLMERFYRGEVISKQLSEDVLKILKLRKNSPLPRLLPANVEIANKPGAIEGVACDWGIVFVPNRPYAIAVMTNYNGDGADNAIANVSKLAYDYCVKLARSTKYGARVPLELLQNKPR